MQINADADKNICQFYWASTRLDWFWRIYFKLYSNIGDFKFNWYRSKPFFLKICVIAVFGAWAVNTLMASICHMCLHRTHVLLKSRSRSGQGHGSNMRSLRRWMTSRWPSHDTKTTLCYEREIAQSVLCSPLVQLQTPYHFSYEYLSLYEVW